MIKENDKQSLRGTLWAGQKKVWHHHSILLMTYVSVWYTSQKLFISANIDIMPMQHWDIAVPTDMLAIQGEKWFCYNNWIHLQTFGTLLGIMQISGAGLHWQFPATHRLFQCLPYGLSIMHLNCGPLVIGHVSTYHWLGLQLFLVKFVLRLTVRQKLYLNHISLVRHTAGSRQKDSY